MAAHMDTPNLSPEAVALLKSLINNPQPVPDSPALQQLFAVRYAMGSPAKAHATSNGAIYIRKR
jgi:hypothetical protein